MEHLKILIPVDFSIQSDYAVDYARNFNGRFDVELMLLNVLEISGFADINREGHFEDLMGINTEMLEIQREAAAEKLKKLHDELQNDFNLVTAHLKLGPLTETIVSFSHHRKVDMILMGTKGGENLKAWFSGSETQIVARRSEIPVLTVMCDRPDSAVDNILFISDFKDDEIAPDPVIVKLAKGFGAKLHLLCVATSSDLDDNQLRRQIEAYASEHHLGDIEVHIHHERNVLDGINQFDRMDEMDMIALGTHGRKGIAHLVKGSIAEKLINHLHKPVLVYKI
jgi:nucleotide-binding universal stress UspA family protein